MATPNMNLILPTPTVTQGPAYASQNNTAFTTIDAHDHTSGKGVPVPSAGINVNADLPFAGFNATALRSTRFTSQASPIALAADVNCLYVSAGNLYYNNASGQQIQLTSGAALNAASIGGIGGDYSTSSASVFYTSASKLFTFWQAANQSAKLDIGPVTIRDTAASAKGVTLLAPAGMGANYQLTFPTGLPATLNLVTMDASGNIGVTMAPSVTSISTTGAGAIGTSLTVGTNLTVTGGSITLAAGGQLSYYTAVAGQEGHLFNPSAGGFLYPNGTTQAAIGTINPSARTLTVKTSGATTAFPIVVSAIPATHGLMIVRGTVNAAGNILRGEGFTVSGPTATNKFSITFSNAFAETPSLIATISTTGTGNYVANGQATSTAAAEIFTWDSSGAGGGAQAIGFSFIAIGQRGQ